MCVAIVCIAWLSAHSRTTYSNRNRNTYLGFVLSSKSPRARLLTVRLIFCAEIVQPLGSMRPAASLKLSRQVSVARRVDQEREYSNHTCTNRGDIDAATLAGCIYRLNYMTSRKFDSLKTNKT